MKRITSYILTLLLLATSSVMAQEENQTDEEITLGLNLNTYGGMIGGGVIRYAKMPKENVFNTFSLEIVNVKHKKEERFSSILTGKTFIRGKQNHLLSIRPQYAREFILFQKYPEEGVRLSAVLGGGPTFGLVKPYFIEYRPDAADDQNINIVAYDPDEHEDSKINGGAGFFTGFDQSKLQMGVNFKAGLNFEFGRYESILSGIETGLSLEAFPERIQLFSSDDNPRHFSAFYITFYYGSRY